MPTFTVIIPTYNRAHFLGTTLESLFAQTFTDFETIVVDDGSTDGTQVLLEGFGDRVQTLKQERQGPSRARNLAAEHARGDYLVFLDSDDLFFPWTLATYAEAVRRAEQPSLVLSRILMFDDPSGLPGEAAPSAIKYWPDYLAAAPARYPVTISVAVRREVFTAAGGFATETDCAEDQDLFLRLGTAPGFAFVDMPPLYAYRQHDDSLTGQADKTYRGMRFVLAREAERLYAGGAARAGERAIVLARMLRYSVGRAYRAGEDRHAYDLYLRGWHYLARAGYWRDLAQFPFQPLQRVRRRLKAG